MNTYGTVVEVWCGGDLRVWCGDDTLEALRWLIFDHCRNQPFRPRKGEEISTRYCTRNWWLANHYTRVQTLPFINDQQRWWPWPVSASG